MSFKLYHQDSFERIESLSYTMNSLASFVDDEETSKLLLEGREFVIAALKRIKDLKDK